MISLNLINGNLAIASSNLTTESFCDVTYLLQLLMSEDVCACIIYRKRCETIQDEYNYF